MQRIELETTFGRLEREARAAAEHQARADAREGFNSLLLDVETVLRRLMQKFSKGMPSDGSAPQLQHALSAAASALNTLGTLRHALALPAVRQIVDQLHAELESEQAQP